MILMLLIPAAAFGQATRESAPPPSVPTRIVPTSVPASNRSLLSELNRETQGLYGELQGGILRVQLPEPVPVRNGMAQNNWIVNKYSRLNNDVRQRLTNQQTPGGNGAVTANAGNTLTAGQNAIIQNARQQNGAANSSDNPANNAGSGYPSNATQNGSNLTIIVPPAAQDQQGQQGNSAVPQQGQAQANGFSPNNIGLLLDDRGHVLVPLYVDRESIGDQPIHLTGAGGAAIDARLVGSDQQTSLTILQLLPPAKTGEKSVVGQAEMQRKSGAGGELESAATGKPLTLSKSKPAEGSLVLLLSPGDGTGRLDVWNGGGRDSGVVVNIDGQVAGIARFGQFLSGPACQLIADQIIRNGSVRRATLGVIISQIEKDDPARRGQPLLGDRPGVRVDEVMARSAAEHGGLKQGDILLSIDGEPANDIPTLAAAIAAKNGPARLQVLRGDRPIELTVDLQRQ